MFDQRRIRKRGLAAQALVLSVREASSLGGNGSWQKYDFILEVRPEGRPPFRAGTISEDEFELSRALRLGR